MATVDHEKIASLALAAYLGLPPRGAKPGIKSNGKLEWTVLAAFALSFPSAHGSNSREYTLISLATGLRCLPYASLPARGDVLHDQHAEVLARRAARLWLLNRLEQELTSPHVVANALFEPEPSDTLDDKKRWRLKTDVRCHLYVSTLPCGAASNRLLEFQRAAQDLAAQKPGAPTPNELLDAYTLTEGKRDDGNRSGTVDVVRGRASSTQQPGTSASLRTKPGRPDAPPSICMSCSDKLALWNASGVGIQGALLSALIAPVYISSVTIADHPLRHIFPFDAEARAGQLKLVLADDCQRALERATSSNGPQGRQSIEVGWSTAVFPDSKEAKLQTNTADAEPESCVNSIVHVSGSGGKQAKTENLAAGTKMGAPTKRAPEQPLKPAARSGVCRLNFFAAIVATMRAMGRSVPDGVSYADAKQGCLGKGTSVYRQAKDAVLGPRETAQQIVDSFLERASRATAINTPAPPPNGASHPSADAPPLHAWLRSPAYLAYFDTNGHRTQ